MLSQTQTRCEQVLSEARVKVGTWLTRPELGPTPCSMTPVPEPRLWNGSPRKKRSRWSSDTARKHTDILDALSQEKRLLGKTSTNCEHSRGSTAFG
jgi:hypothetical protein